MRVPRFSLSSASIALTLTLALAVIGCAGGQSAPTPDIEATVEARLAQERADEATIDAGDKQGIAAQPPATPYPTYTPVAEPTATTIPTATPRPLPRLRLGLQVPQPRHRQARRIPHRPPRRGGLQVH